MNLDSLFKLFTEFLDMFKGKDKDKFTDILSSLGNIEILEKVLKSKYIKYLPLLPLLAKVSKEGFKSLLNNTDDIKSVLSVLSQSESGMLKNINLDDIAKFLPQIIEIFNKRDSKTQETPLIEQNITSQREKTVQNPIACISDIADKDIIYALNKYISKDLR